MTGILWLVKASPRSVSSFSHGILPLYMSVSKFLLFVRTPVILDYGPPYSPQLNLIICKEPVSKSGHKYWGLRFQHPLSEWVKVAQLCQTLCNPMGYTFHGILQARILEWVAFPFSRGSSQPRDQTQVSHVADDFFTSWATREAQ